MSTERDFGQENNAGFEHASSMDIKPVLAAVSKFVPQDARSHSIRESLVKPHWIRLIEVDDLTEFSVKMAYEGDKEYATISMLIPKPELGINAQEYEAWHILKDAERYSIDRKTTVDLGPEDFCSLDNLRKSINLQRELGMNKVSKQECSNMVRRLNSTSTY
jgi:hypothetical protein